MKVVCCSMRICAGNIMTSRIINELDGVSVWRGCFWVVIIIEEILPWKWDTVCILTNGDVSGRNSTPPDATTEQSYAFYLFLHTSEDFRANQKENRKCFGIWDPNEVLHRPVQRGLTTTDWWPVFDYHLSPLSPLCFRFQLASLFFLFHKTIMTTAIPFAASMHGSMSKTGSCFIAAWLTRWSYIIGIDMDYL